MKPDSSTSFGPVKQVDAGLLNVGYAEAGSPDGPAVMLLHGWPYDIYSFADVTPLLASEGYRVIVPFVRGYGTTRFLSDDTPRGGGCHRAHGRARHREGHLGRLRLGGTVGRCRGGAVAGPLHGAGLGERVPDRQPGRQPGALAAEGRARRTISGGVGHNLPQEAPQAFAQAVADAGRF